MRLAPPGADGLQRLRRPGRAVRPNRARKPAAQAAGWAALARLRRRVFGGAGGGGDGGTCRPGMFGHRRRRAGQLQPGEGLGRGGRNAGRLVSDRGGDLSPAALGVSGGGAGARRRDSGMAGYSPAGVAAAGQSRHLPPCGTNQRAPNSLPEHNASNNPDAAPRRRPAITLIPVIKNARRPAPGGTRPEPVCLRTAATERIVQCQKPKDRKTRTSSSPTRNSWAARWPILLSARSVWSMTG